MEGIILTGVNNYEQMTYIQDILFLDHNSNSSLIEIDSISVTIKNVESYDSTVSKFISFEDAAGIIDSVYVKNLTYDNIISISGAESAMLKNVTFNSLPYHENSPSNPIAIVLLSSSITIEICYFDNGKIKAVNTQLTIVQTTIM